jgi:hypothetical protein
MGLAPLWKCPKCARFFANRKQSHFCSRYTLREHLAGRRPVAVALFRHFTKLVKLCGPVRVVPEKTRIAFQVRMSFAAVSLRRDRIVGHVVLARRLENSRFTKIGGLLHQRVKDLRAFPLDLLRENSDPANYFLAQRRTLTVTLVTLSESI